MNNKTSNYILESEQAICLNAVQLLGYILLDLCQNNVEVTPYIYYKCLSNLQGMLHN